MPVETAVLPALSFANFGGGIVEIGHGEAGFALDSEGPRHRVLTKPFRLADRLVSNAEWMEFIEDGGYAKPLLGLAACAVMFGGVAATIAWFDARMQAMTARAVTMRVEAFMAICKLPAAIETMHASYWKTSSRDAKWNEKITSRHF